jgi:hypothetical protein
MADQPRHPDISDDTRSRDSAALGPARPRWTAALLIVIVTAAVLLVIILHVTGVVGANTNG